MDSSQAPELLMKVIRYQRKDDCPTKKCRCRKHDVDCSTSCNESKGVHCKNCSVDTVDVDDINLGVE